MISQLQSDLPILNPVEHAEIEARLGRSLTNEEAHAALRQLTLDAAVHDYIEGRIR